MPQTTFGGPDSNHAVNFEVEVKMKANRQESDSIVRQFTKDYLLISLIPLILILVLGLAGAITATMSVGNIIERSIRDLNSDANNYLNELGEIVIQNKARDVSRQVEVFLKSNPVGSMEELQENRAFREIALQGVGDTGYTCLYEAGTAIMRIHPNPILIDADMELLAEKLPSWWAIFEPTLAGIEVSGYYDWLEPNGTIRKKYMTMTPVTESFHGTTLMIAATTYIDEFSLPVAAMDAKADEIAERYRRFASRGTWLFAAAAATVLFLTFSGVYLIGRRAALNYILPIEQLGEAVRNLGKGNWKFSGPPEMLNRKDEIGALAQAFDRVSRRLSELFASLQERVEELKQTQEALRESETHYRNLFDGVPIGLYQTGPEGEILDVNPSLVSMLGYPSRESFMQRNASEMYANPNDRARWKNLMENGGDIITHEIEMRQFNDNVIWVENQSRTVRETNDRVLYYEGCLKDITERKKAEQSQMESEKKYRDLYAESKRAEEVYRSLIHSSPDPIVIYDLKGNVQYISPVFTQLFGWTEAEVKGKPVPYLPAAEQEATMSLIRDVIENDVICQGYESRRYTKDKRLIDVSISASRYDDHEGKPAGMLVILRDISQRKKLEAQLQHAERMEAIGTLAGGVAHDFNNLMLGIQGNLSLMLSEMDENHPNFKRIKSIENLIQSGAQLTGHLLGYARKGRYEIRPVDLNTIALETSETFGRTRKDITVHLDLDSSLKAIEADKAQIEQVLMNLCINAADAMPDGGDLFLKTSSVNHTDIGQQVNTPNPGAYVHLQVRDTGMGIDEKNRERIFDPFFTTKAMGRGTGLGLASVYGIVKAHDGFIDVDSKIDRGTTFNIYLPGSDKQPLHQETSQPDVITCQGKAMLVDDEEIAVDVGAEMLQKAGFSVVSAMSGKEAIELYREKRDEIDLVILDMIMPDIGGGEVFDEIRAMNPQAKVLLSSGYSIDGKATEILQRGCNGFIQKPFGLEQLMKKISEIIEKN